MSAGNRAASSAGGSIYDLGYRHYEGKRLGRFYAIWSLYVDSLRGIWGFGRPMSAKAAPFILAGLYAFPAFIQLAFSSLIAANVRNGESPDIFAYHNYFTGLAFFVILFCVAQAPEVVCRDQRYQVLPLYFTRAMHRTDYALARLASLATALFLMLAVPMVTLFIGQVLQNPDTFGAIGTELPKALPAIPATLLIALSMSAISLALSSYSPRRAYAAIGLVAYFLLMEAVPAIVYAVGHEAGWTWADKLELMTPINSLGGATDWFFGHGLGIEFPTTIDAGPYVIAALTSVILFTSILMFRYRRIAA